MPGSATSDRTTLGSSTALARPTDAGSAAAGSARAESATAQPTQNAEQPSMRRAALLRARAARDRSTDMAREGITGSRARRPSRRRRATATHSAWHAIAACGPVDPSRCAIRIVRRSHASTSRTARTLPLVHTQVREVGARAPPRSRADGRAASTSMGARGLARTDLSKCNYSNGGDSTSMGGARAPGRLRGVLTAGGARDGGVGLRGWRRAGGYSGVRSLGRAGAGGARRP